MKKRKTDLFRFVTLRTPELISSDKKALGFIEHPHFSLGDFMPEIQPTLVETRVAFEEIADDIELSAYTTTEELKTLIGLPAWDFSMWLAKNKNNLKRSELDAIVVAPTSTDMVIIWDNLFYDILRIKNPYVRQACLQVIVAENFVANYVAYSPGITIIEDEIAAEALALKRLANAKVVIHEAFSIEKVASTASSLLYNLTSRKSFELTHLSKIAQCKLSALIAIKEDLADLEIEYNSDYKDAYGSAYSANKSAAKVTVDAYKLANPSLDYLLEESYPQNLVTPFNFSYSDPLSTTFTADKIVAKTTSYLDLHRLRNNSFSSVFEFVNAEIDALKKQSSHTSKNKFSAISINGVSIKPSSSKPIDYAYSLEEDEDNPGQYKVMLSVDVGYKGAYVVTNSTRLTIGANTYIVSGRKLANFQNNHQKTVQFHRLKKIDSVSNNQGLIVYLI